MSLRVSPSLNATSRAAASAEAGVSAPPIPDLDGLRPLGRKHNPQGIRQTNRVGHGRGRGRGSPGGPVPRPRRSSPTLSPSILGAGTGQSRSDDFALPEPAAQPTARSASSSNRSSGRSTAPPDVPDGPSTTSSTGDSSSTPLLSATARIGVDEAYGTDERDLNTFLKLHSMLSMDATSRKTLQLVSNMFEKSSVSTHELPIVPKSYDDMYLRCEPLCEPSPNPHPRRAVSPRFARRYNAC